MRLHFLMTCPQLNTSDAEIASPADDSPAADMDVDTDSDSQKTLDLNAMLYGRPSPEAETADGDFQSVAEPRSGLRRCRAHEDLDDVLALASNLDDEADVAGGGGPFRGDEDEGSGSGGGERTDDDSDLAGSLGESDSDESPSNPHQFPSTGFL